MGSLRILENRLPLFENFTLFKVKEVRMYQLVLFFIAI